MRWLVVAVLLGPALAAGCAGPAASAPPLVPYPHLGDVATYALTGSYLEIARWENGHPVQDGTQLRFEVAASPKVLDGARQVHDVYRVTTSLDGVKHADLYVSPTHDAIVQSVYPLSQDQNVVAFDERGFPWLFGASALFGREARQGSAPDLVLPENLAPTGAALVVAPQAGPQAVVGSGLPTAKADGEWQYAGVENGSYRFDLRDLPGVNGTLWMARGSAWPVRAHLVVDSDALAPNVRVDAPLPAEMDARLVSLQPGTTPLPPRDSAATFLADGSVKRVAWNGQEPPDGDAGYVPYLLADATRDAQLLDGGLQSYLKSAQDPRLYRATFKMVPLNATGPLNSTLEPYWLLEWMEQGGHYYQVEIQRVDAPAPPATPAPLPLPASEQGVPRVLSSGPADPPQDPLHGWFPREAEPQQLVPLSEGFRVVRAVFGAHDIQIFLRSYAKPPGYSYFLDGGWEQGEDHRYTVVYDPANGFIQEATGPVTARFAT